MVKWEGISLRDKKFERFVGVIPEMLDVPKNKDEILKEQNMTKEKLISDADNFISKYGKKYEGIYNVVKEVRNYEYDYRVAIFMLIGIKAAPLHALLDLPKEWPFGLKTEGYNVWTTTWCDAFQTILFLNDNMDILDVNVDDNGRLGRFEYHKLMDIQDKLTSKIDEDCEQENRLLCCDKELDDEQLKELNRLQSATQSRKENRILQDMVLGKSLSITLYYGIKMIYRKAGIEFNVFEDFIKAVSSLKCFQFRNIIADIFFQILLQENDLSDDKVKNVAKDIKELMLSVNQYYNTTLTLRWYDRLKDPNLKDKEYCCNFLDIEADSIGFYIDDGNQNSYIVEKNIPIIKGIYTVELENDLKNLHSAKYNYSNDKDILYIDGLPPFLIGGSKSVEEKEAEILKEEFQNFKNSEKIMKIMKGRKKVTSNASALFTYIHWEVMKMNGKSGF